MVFKIIGEKNKMVHGAVNVRVNISKTDEARNYFKTALKSSKKSVILKY